MGHWALGREHGGDGDGLGEDLGVSRGQSLPRTVQLSWSNLSARTPASITVLPRGSPRKSSRRAAFAKTRGGRPGRQEVSEATMRGNGIVLDDRMT